jgi:Fic family protein
MKKLPISLRFIRELHGQLMGGVRGKDKMPGEFRRDQNWIGPPGASIQDATYIPPPPQEMNRALEELETFLHLHSELPPLVRMALVHYQFEAIHPFLDGNGRIGRLLIPLLLIQEDLLPQPLLYLSAYFEKTRDAYYAHLLSVSQRSQWTPWIQYFLQGVAEQSRDAVARSRKLIDLQRRYRRRLETGRGSALLLRLVDSLFADPFLSTTDAAKRVNVTYAAASQHISKLVQANILQRYGPTMYRQMYLAREIIELSETNRLADLLPDLFHDVP